MKIYTEVIMQWDEDKGKLVEISSDSYEHKGKIALCGGGGLPGYGISGGPGQAGWQAAGLGRKSYIHPSKIGQEFGAEFDMPDHLNPREAPIARTGLEPMTNWFDKIDPATGQRLQSFERKSRRNVAQHIMGGIGQILDQTVGGVGRWLHGGSGPVNPKGMRKPRGVAMENVAQEYSHQFGPGWYDPYIQSAIAGPGEQISTQELINVGDMPGMSEIGSLYGGGTPLVQKSAPYGITEAGEELGRQEEAYMGEMDRLQKEEVQTRLIKSEADKQANIERAEFLKGQVPAEEARQAKLAKTGMAYTAPGERLATTERGKGLKTLRDVTEAKRKGQREYEGAMQKLRESREGAYEGYQEAKRGFAGDVVGSLTDADADLQSLLKFSLDLPLAHRRYGEQALEQKGWGTPGAWYDLGGQTAGQMVGQGEESWGAPLGGWFDEQSTGVAGMGVPAFAQAKQDIGSAVDFSDWLTGPGGPSTQTIADLLADPEWVDPGTGGAWTPTSDIEG